MGADESRPVGVEAAFPTDVGFLIDLRKDKKEMTALLHAAVISHSQLPPFNSALARSRETLGSGGRPRFFPIAPNETVASARPGPWPGAGYSAGR